MQELVGGIEAMEPGVSMASRPLRFFAIHHYDVCSVCLLGRGNRTTIGVSDVRDSAPLVLLATTLPSETFRAPIPFLRSPNPIQRAHLGFQLMPHMLTSDKPRKVLRQGSNGQDSEKDPKP